MKQLFVILITLTMFSACNRKDDNTNRDMLYITDTTALNRGYADTAAVKTVVTTTTAAPSPRRSTTTRRSTSGTVTSTST